MSCIICENIGDSYKEKPFSPPGGYKNGENTFHQCPGCGQRWYCYNDYRFLWGEVNDDFTWKLIINNIDSIPIAIGGVCGALKDGYEEFDIDPVHKPCEKKIFFPQLVQTTTGEGENQRKIIAVQWLGDYEPRNLFQYQFEFPLFINLDDYLPIIDEINVIFIGEIGSFPDPNQRDHLLKHFRTDNQEKVIIYLASHEGNQRIKDAGFEKPLSFVAEVVLLGDPNVGVIKPQEFYDPSRL